MPENGTRAGFYTADSSTLNRSGGKGGSVAPQEEGGSEEVGVMVPSKATPPATSERMNSLGSNGVEKELLPNGGPHGNATHKPSASGWSFLRSMAFLSLLTLVIQNSSLVLLTRYSRSRIPPEHTYHTSTLVLNQEILKMIMCLAIFAFERRCDSIADYGRQLHAAVFQKETLKLIVPAALFTFQNWLLFVALTHLDAMMFQVISQTKLLSAAIFSVWLLDRRLSRIQWFTLVLLTIGILFSQADNKKQQSSNAVTFPNRPAQNPVLGIFACVASGLSSSFAGVYFEKVVKTTAPSLAIRNIHLSVFGIPFALLSMIVLDVGLADPNRPFEFWRGYDQTLTWVLVAVHALGGLLVAVVVKYADNILKGFATGVAIIVSGIFAAFFWGFIPSTYFVAGSVLVIVSSVLYQYGEPPKGSGK